MRSNKYDILFMSELNDNIPEKPPLGIIPASIYHEKRIKQLADAIERYADTGIYKHTTLVKKWAQETILLCEIIEKIGNKVQPQ